MDSKVRLTYDSGPDTELQKKPELVEILKQAGEPKRIRRLLYGWVLEWDPLYPGVPDLSYTLGNPWPNEYKRRELVRVHLPTEPSTNGARR